MNKALSHLKILVSVLLGNIMKVKSYTDVMLIGRIKLTPLVANGVIISLTSYGQRVRNNSVSHTIYSLLKQQIRPEKIVLWLDETEYNNDTLPVMLQKLQRWGLEIRYCPNMRSYKKILPSLKAYPQYDIVTADDDIYYTKEWFSEIIHTAKLHPHCIITQALRFPKLTEDGKFAPYRHWTMKHVIRGDEDYPKVLAMPLGGFGTLYPAHILDEETLRYDIISQICPYADDLWLYVMGLRLHIQKENVRNTRSTIYQLDLIRQRLSRDRLFATNVGEDQNDIQLHRLLVRYKINPSALK